jgi:hypothetical protein
MRGVKECANDWITLAGHLELQIENCKLKILGVIIWIRQNNY